jgi:hypothetical protein
MATGARKFAASTKVALVEPRRRGGRGWKRWLGRLRAHVYRAVVKQVYKEADLMQIFAANGWVLAEKQPLVTTKSVRYFCYLFARKAAEVSPARSAPAKGRRTSP